MESRFRYSTCTCLVKIRALECAVGDVSCREFFDASHMLTFSHVRDHYPGKAAETKRLCNGDNDNDKDKSNARQNDTLETNSSFAIAFL